jgi:hypothetical protein
MTFGTRKMAQSWAATIEGEIEQLKASGFLKPAGLTVGDLIDRYVSELYPLKRWSASKTREIRVQRRTEAAAEIKPDSVPPQIHQSCARSPQS